MLLHMLGPRHNWELFEGVGNLSTAVFQFLEGFSALAFRHESGAGRDLSHLFLNHPLDCNIFFLLCKFIDIPWYFSVVIVQLNFFLLSLALNVFVLDLHSFVVVVDGTVNICTDDIAIFFWLQLRSLMSSWNLLLQSTSLIWFLSLISLLGSVHSRDILVLLILCSLPINGRKMMFSRVLIVALTDALELAWALVHHKLFLVVVFLSLSWWFSVVVVI
jgi:hypothetical protein